MIMCTSNLIKQLLTESIKDGSYFATVLNMCIAAHIVDIMRIKNISVKDLAITLNVDEEQIENYIHADIVSFDTQLLGQLSVALGVEFEINTKLIDLSTDFDIKIFR